MAFRRGMGDIVARGIKKAAQERGMEDSVKPEEIISFCKARMAAYKHPRKVEIVSEIPKTLTGKFLRRTLREKER